MEHSIIIEFVPPNDQTRNLIFENFSQLKGGDPEEYPEQYKNIKAWLAKNHPFVDFLFERAFFNYSEITLDLNPVYYGPSIRMETTTIEDVGSIEGFISTFGTFLLDIDCELVAIKAIGPGVTLVGYVDNVAGEDGGIVEVVEEGDLENVLAEINEDWVNDTLYTGVDDIYKGSSTHGKEFGFDDVLHFWIYDAQSSVPLKPVSRDPARWSGAFSYFNEQKESWIDDIEFEVFVENIEDASERIIHFKCGDLSISARPPLCIVPNKNGDLKNYDIKQVMPGSIAQDEEIERILEEAWS